MPEPELPVPADEPGGIRVAKGTVDDERMPVLDYAGRSERLAKPGGLLLVLICSVIGFIGISLLMLSSSWDVGGMVMGAILLPTVIVCVVASQS